MTLKDQMADDITDVFLNEEYFADAAFFSVKGVANRFALTVVLGDPQPGFFQIDGGQEDRRPVSILAKRSTIRAGIQGITGIARDPIKGDAIIIESGANEGTWLVQTAAPDVGDGMAINAVKADLYTVNDATAREIR